MKKFLALVLSLIMAVSLIPFSAFAYDGNIADLEFIPSSPLFVYYESNGYWDTDENDESYYFYNGFIRRSEGDVLTIIDDLGNRHTYTAEYNDSEGKFYLVGDGDSFPYDDVEMINEQNQPGKHFKLGNENYFYIEYKGVRKSVSVEVIQNPVKWIEFVSESPIRIVENTGGHWDEDENGKFYYYEIPDFREGDMLYVCFAGDENPTAYRYSNDYNDFVDENNNILENSDELYRSKPGDARWSADSNNEYKVVYSGIECPVSVEIIQNTVTAIEYKRAVGDEYIEGNTRYDSWDNAYYYEHPRFEEGDVLTVFEGDTSTRYICKSSEEDRQLFFESEDGEKIISCDTNDGIRISDSQNQTPWEIGNKNEFYVEYMGQKYTLFATVKENPVESISYQRARADEYIFEAEGYENDGTFEYWIHMANEGDVLTVNYKGGQSKEYICKTNNETYQREFVDESNDVISEEAVEFYSDQRNHPWTIGNDNPYTVSYSGRSTTLFATVKVNPIQSIEYQRKENAVIYENTQGWDNGEFFYYSEPSFINGDTLIVNYTEEGEKLYTFGYNEKIGHNTFTAEDGDVIDDVRLESNQWDEPWKVGVNEYYVSYLGICSNPIKVTILKNTLTGIDIVKAKEIVIFEDDKKEMYFPSADSTYEGYEIPFFEAGDILILHDSEAGDIEYTFTLNENDGEYYFANGNDLIAREDIYVYDYQFMKPWSVNGEDNYFFVQYREKTCNVPVTIAKSNVESISYTVANPERLILSENHGGRWENNGKDFFFYDYQNGWVGDTLTVNYKDATSSVFTVKFDGASGGIGVYLENDKGERISQSELDLFDNQWENHWTPDSKNVYYAKYKGAICEIPVTVNHIPAKAVKENEVKATYDKAGSYDEVVYCSECKKELSRTPKTIAKLAKTSLAKATVSQIKDKTYTGKALTQSLTVKLGSKTLKNGTDYKVTYKNNKNVGKATVTITGINAYSGTISKTFKINPKGTTLSKVTAGSKSFTATWKKQATQTTGYEIQYATDSKFTKGKKTVTVSKNGTVKTTVKKLTAKKKYYVRIRTYKTVSKTKYYSAWSSSKTVTTKK
ncbi:MAG: fibronectin type III domain-containing protein [Eubacterium sp.]|nr:fibronectin type III domain-containing protein [Eubacterium sp.]